MKLTRFMGAGFCLSLSPIVLAQSPDNITELDSVTVSANRVPTELSKVGSSVEVITEQDLQDYTQLTVQEYLDITPGINFSQNGGVGSTATLSLRGAYQRYVLVRIDGVDISDPSDGQVAADISQLLVEDIERIEVLRGSQSSLYGGQAVGGVIDIRTKRGKQGVQQRAGLEVGENNTLRAYYNLGVGHERGEYNINVQGLSTDGISAADENDGNREKDGYDNTSLTMRGSYDLNDQLSLKGSLRYVDRDTEFDGFQFGVGVVDDTFGNHTEGKHTAASLGLEFETLDGKQNHDVTLSYYDTERDTFSDFPGSFDGQRTKLDYVGSHTFNPRWNTVFGASYTQEEAQTSGGLDNDTDITGAFVQLGFNPTENWFLTAAVRNDNHSEFGNHTTWRATSAHQITPQTKLRASGGTGFRAPSNFELFDSQFGNPDLEPETSKSFDIGIDQKLFNGKGEFSLGYFTLDTEDLIEFSFPEGYTQTNGESERAGYELSFKYRFNDQFRIQANYTHMDKAEQPDGTPLTRVPEDKIAVSVNYHRNRWKLNSTAQYVSGSLDTNAAANNEIQELDNYFVVNNKLSYAINPNFEVYGRIDNLFDEEYQTVRGYGTADRTAYVGANIRF